MAKNTAKKNVAPKQEKPRHDDEKYGEVLYSLSYDMDDLTFFNASGLIGSSRTQQIIPVVSMILLLAIIGSLYDREHPIYPVAIASFILFIAISIAWNRWSNIRDWYVSKTNLALTGDPARHVVVTKDALIVEGPDDTVATYALSEIKKVDVDSDGALVKLGQKRYVYIPARSLSDSRYAALIKMLREKH